MSYGSNAGSDDFVLKEIEQEAILKLIPNGSKIIEFGCGNGNTLIRLAKENHCHGIGYDFSSRMIDLANVSTEESDLQQSVRFSVGDILSIQERDSFDFAFTQRCLINLTSDKEKVQAFHNIMSALKTGGKYIMVESSTEPLTLTNSIRKDLGLNEIVVPWHNKFFTPECIEKLKLNGQVRLLKEANITSTYYFISRIVYAKLAEERGEGLKYDSELNLLAKKLPNTGDFGPVRLWLWEKL